MLPCVAENASGETELLLTSSPYPLLPRARRPSPSPSPGSACACARAPTPSFGAVRQTQSPIQIRVKVIDANDHFPEFSADSKKLAANTVKQGRKQISENSKKKSKYTEEEEAEFEKDRQALKAAYEAIDTNKEKGKVTSTQILVAVANPMSKFNRLIKRRKNINMTAGSLKIKFAKAKFIVMQCDARLHHRGPIRKYVHARWRKIV